MSYDDFYEVPVRSVVFFIPIITSVLWSFGFLMMVNQRLNAENLEEKEKWRLVFNMSPDAKAIARVVDGILVDVNAGFLVLTGYEREEILGKSIRALGVWDRIDDLQKFASELEKDGVVENREFIFRRKDGNRFIGVLSGRLILIDELPHVVCIVHDVTQRRQAEQEVQKLLAEKELLLKEVHHRIKNNMSSIHSLLSLQAGTLKDPLAVAALEDAKSRILSMGTLYNVLYKTVNFSELSVSDYLPPLIDEIISNFPDADAVVVEKHIDAFSLEIRKLQPLGMIINELLTNIMKYAFSDIADPRITVSASLANGRVAIAVQDNGVGIDESVDFKNSTGFGLMLVGALTEQLSGEIRIERGSGTKMILEFEK
jgi:PAS domain S-box-containing protein